MRFQAPTCVGLLRNYCQQGRRTAELAELLAVAAATTRTPRDKPLPQRNSLHRSVVKLIVDDYQGGSSTYELAERYGVRRNTVRDVLRREGFDPSDNAKRPSLREEQKVQIRERFNAGTTRRELMSAFKVSETTIKRVLRG